MGELGGEAGAEFFAERGDGNAAAVLELDLQDGLLGAAVPLMDEIDGIVRRMHADEAHADGDFIGAGFFADDRQCAQGDLLGGFKARGGGGTQAELELTGVDLREDFGAYEGEQDADGEDDANEVGGDEDVTRGERGEENPAQCGFACGFGFRLSAWYGMPPNVEDWHEGAGEQIGGDHAEAHGE